jgi:hypothetical protein
VLVVVLLGGQLELQLVVWRAVQAAGGLSAQAALAQQQQQQQQAAGLPCSSELARQW